MERAQDNVLIYRAIWDGKHGSHELLQRAMEDFLQEKQQNFTIVQEKTSAKPYWKERRDIHFSISHSDEIWMSAVSTEKVGLDVQKGDVKKPEKLARRFYHPDEIAWLETNGFEQHFCRVWAYKESYVKYSGVGLAQGLDYFSVVPFLEGADFANEVCQQELPLEEGAYAVLTTGKQVNYQWKEL